MIFTVKIVFSFSNENHNIALLIPQENKADARMDFHGGVDNAIIMKGLLLTRKSRFRVNLRGEIQVWPCKVIKELILQAEKSCISLAEIQFSLW